MKITVKNRTVLIDKADMPVFNSRRWYISDTGYVVWRGVEGGKKRTIRLHRLIIGSKDGEIVDHINRNKLDNRRHNLRVVSAGENIRNSDRFDQAKYYYFDKNKGRWTIDSKKHGVRGLYMDSEQDCVNYIAALDNGEAPIRVFNRRPSLSARKITDEDIAYIFDEYNKGKIKRRIAEDLGYSESAVGRIINGRTTMAGTMNMKVGLKSKRKAVKNG